MDTSPIPGFITRKQASERCQRAERTLQRYWSRAIEMRDEKVLRHLKLRAENGDTTEGADVTKDLIERLKRKGQNPTWYVHATWVQDTYGPRADSDEPPSTPKEPVPATPESTASAGDMTTFLKEQLEKKDEEIAHLRGELGIKNEQIRDANERTRESNVLMRDLQKMFGDWQQQAFRTLPPAASSAKVSNRRSSSSDVTVEVPEADTQKLKQGSGRKRKSRSSKPVKPTETDKPRKAPGKRPSVFEKHTPTFHKALYGLLRR